MVAVIERKDGTHILCTPYMKHRLSHRRTIIIQFLIADTCLSLGLWLLLS